MSGPLQRINPDTFYVDGVQLPAGWWDSIDLTQSQEIDGDAGGSWSPSSLMTIAGAGLWSADITDLHAAPSVTGTPLITHGDSDYVKYLGGHQYETRNLSCSLACGRDASFGSAFFDFGTTDDCFISKAPGARLVCPLDVHNGALLQSVTFYFLVATHTGVPATLPQFRVFKVDSLGNVTNLLAASTTTGWQGNGFVVLNPTPASAAAWNATTSFTITAASSGAAIDTSSYAYFVEVQDEQGTNALAGNKYLQAQAFFSSILDARPY